MRRLVAGIALAILVASPVTAGPSAPLTLPTGYPVGGEKQNPVEQQSDSPWLPGPLDCSANIHCVINPTNCAWDVDDHWQYIVVGRTLTAGVTASGTVCSVFEQKGHVRTICGITGIGCLTASWASIPGRLGLHLHGPSPDLVVTIAYPAQGKSFTLGAVPYDEQGCRGCWVYEFCGHARYDNGDLALGPIPGSSGGPLSDDGVGIVSPIVISVANPTGRAVKGLVLNVQEVGAGSSGASCLTDTLDSQMFHDYPLRWTQS